MADAFSERREDLACARVAVSARSAPNPRPESSGRGVESIVYARLRLEFGTAPWTSRALYSLFKDLSFRLPIFSSFLSSAWSCSPPGAAAQAWPSLSPASRFSICSQRRSSPARLMRAVQTPPTPEAELRHSDAEAIVVLSAGYQRYAPEYGGETIDDLTLARLRYAAHLARATGSAGAGHRRPRQGRSAIARRADADSVTGRFRRSRCVGSRIARAIRSRMRCSVPRCSRPTTFTPLFSSPTPRIWRGPSAYSNARACVWCRRRRCSSSATARKPDIMPRHVGPCRIATTALYEMIGGLWYRLRH